MPIDYRYHIGSFVAIFLALLLGILVGIGLAPNPAELDQVVGQLKQQFREAQQSREAELEQLRQERAQYEALAKQILPITIANRLSGKRVAIILNHEFGNDPLPEHLRALLRQAGASLTATATITRDFATLPTPVRQRVARRLSLYPPPGVHFRSLIAEAWARDLAGGRAELVKELHQSGLVRSSADSDYRAPVDAVLLVGGPRNRGDAAPERVDVPLIAELTRLGVRVVGCEETTAPISSIPLYQSRGIPTVDNADTLPGRLAVVLALAGADGHFGVKDTADRLLPDLTSPPPA